MSNKQAGSLFEKVFEIIFYPQLSISLCKTKIIKEF